MPESGLEYFLNMTETKINFLPVTDCRQIDISRHGLIEASAGTGKTYTIENMVVRFLKERDDIFLENILLVTFTEKATCELKSRIREKLETQLPSLSGEMAGKIKTALDAFDTASIFTIHGFCRSVLKDYAFENQALFQWELTNDTALKETLVKEQIRKIWPTVYQDYFRDILEISGFIHKKDRFISQIISLESAFCPEVGDTIFPETGTLTDSEITGKLQHMRELVIELKAMATQNAVFCEGFDQLNIHAGTKRAVQKNLIRPLKNSLLQIDAHQLSYLPLFKIFDYVCDKGNDYFEFKYLKKGPNPEVCPQWFLLKQRLCQLTDLYKKLKDVLMVQSVYRLREDVQKEKFKKGLISYDDMLLQVKTALYSSGGHSLIESLRKKYKVAFVDEFQDTDPVQWKIFRKLFLETGIKKPSANVLYLIGDPKQAIYAFRGADVFAYLEAKNEMIRLSASKMAACYCLVTNWRSEPDLITVFNRLFSIESWFKPPDQCNDYEIGYLSVNPPEANHRNFAIADDKTNRPALTIVDLSDALRLKTAKPLLATFIAGEIHYLVNCGGFTCLKKDSPPEKISYGDICILVRTGNEAAFVENELKNHHIPYSYYKKPGLFHSNEALYLSFLFHAIADPGDPSALNKALLTPFFNFQPSDLPGAKNLSAAHPVKQMLFQWNEYALDRRWSLLFQSLLEHSGLIYRECKTSDWERKFANYRQLFEYLHDAAYRNNLDFRGITAILDGYRKGTFSPAEEADVHQIETEAQKVQIMTMHVAKGLEFSVVFIFGGLTQKPVQSQDWFVYHDIQDAKSIVKTFDISKTIGREKGIGEIKDEEKRLLYVALTRARFKLYVPFYSCLQNLAAAGPVPRLLSPALAETFAEQNDQISLAAWINASEIKKDTRVPKTQPEKESAMMPPTKGIEHLPEKIIPISKDFRHRRIELASFSSIHRHISDRGIHHQLPGFHAMVKKPKEDDEDSFLLSPQAPFEYGDPNDIPGGTEIGSMFHEILEQISFKTVREMASSIHPTEDISPLLTKDDVKELILNCMKLHQVDRRWLKPISDIIFRVLTAPVDAVYKGFYLAGLEKTDRLHEVEFYFPFPRSFSVTASGTVPGCRWCDGFIRGFVDLIFRVENKFYIADWKSNILENGYEHSAMEENMIQADYHLQYKIYTIAALRWLAKTLGNQFSPDKNFGGVFYFYLRGMGQGEGSGIYYVPGHQVGTLKSLEKDLHEVGR
jgi:exodeoxyribonuclease V beta subunit